MPLLNKGFVKNRLAGAVSLFALATSAFTISVHADTAEFSIKSQPLSVALNRFSEQSNIIVVAPAGLVRDKKAPAVMGVLEAEAALKMMLSGTGLDYQVDENGTIIISQANLSDGAISDASDSNEDVSFMLEEIIVTATRREASMQDVPMSINAFNGERIRKSGINNVQDLQFLSAGLHVANENGMMRVAIRGIGSNQSSPGAESGAAVSRDGVYLAMRQDVGMGFFDIERVEILKGPQGTLYGKNATGGAVNIITKAPTEEFEAGGSVTIGNYDLVETQGFVSGPLAGDKLTARFAFKTRDHDGYTPNIFNGRDEDNGDFSGVRGRVRYEPSNSFYLDLTADYTRDNGLPSYVHSRGRSGEPITGELPPYNSVLPEGRSVNHNNAGVNRKETWGLTAKAEWNFDTMALKSLTAYRELHWLANLDLDGTDVDLFYLDGEDRDAKQFSQELTLSSSSDSLLQWIVGGYYFQGRETSFLPIPIPVGGLQVDLDADVADKAYALFGQASYQISNRLTLTLGGRYSYEEKSSDSIVDLDIEGLGLISTTEYLEDNWSSFTPKAALNYALSDDITAYATVSKGFKAGGYEGNAQQGRAYDPETVINYEIGVKATFFDGSLRANLSAFYMDYSDLQVQVQRLHPVTGTFSLLIDNAATATIQGLEFDFEARPLTGLMIDGGLSYLDATYDHWPDAVDSIRGDTEFDVSGNKLLGTPEWAGNISASYTFGLASWGSATLRGEYAYKGRVYFSPFEEPFLSQKGFGLFNARLSFSDADERWTIALWARNITDELVASSRLEEVAAGQTASNFYLPPRTYGVTVGYRF